MNKMKNAISEHFNEVSIRDSNSNLRLYGSKSNHYLLQDPYIYIENLLLNLKKNKTTVLDYCCGTGLFSIFPALNNYKVFGMDISENSINIAKKKAKNYGVHNNCKFEKMDAEKLDYDENTFDIVVAYNSLSYLDLEKSYQELNRVTKPDGKIIIMDSLGNNPIFQINRNKNLKKWAPEFMRKFTILKKSDLDNAKKYFSLEEINYYNFFSPFFFYISKKTPLNFNYNFIKVIDSFIMKLPFSYLIAFKYVAIYSPKKKNI